jgi:hypothetical protein
MPLEHPHHGRAALALLALITLLSAGCGSGSSATEPATSASADGKALAASSSGELLEHVKSLLRTRAEQRQVNPGVALDGVPTAGPALAVSATGTAVVYANTNVQEGGVDEEDLLKTDGNSVYALDTTTPTATGEAQQRLRVLRRSAAGAIEPVQLLGLPAEASAYALPRGLLLAAQARRLVALSESLIPVGDPLPCRPLLPCPASGALIYAPFAIRSSVQLQFIELDAVGDATLGRHAAIDGRLVGSRLIGNVLLLVTTHAPRLAFEQLPAETTPQQQQAELAKLTTADFLPAWRADGSAALPLVADTNCYIQPTNRSVAIEVTTITTIDLASPTLVRASRCFVGGTEALYMAPKNLYLATTRFPYVVLDNGRIQYAPQFATDLHKFSVDGLAIDYRASGEVSGHLGWDAQRKPYRLGEHNGDLRVLSFTGQTGWVLLEDASSASAPPPSPATLTVLREAAGSKTLATVATLPNRQHPEPLGKPGEQVHAVRFDGTRGYLVTFRNVDPLYVLDLADPADPRVAGSLEVPGFSDYLFPLADGLVFGVGREVDANGRLGGIQFGLFDVGDAMHPKALDIRAVGAAGSQSALDYSSHGMTWVHSGSVARIGLPMSITATPYAAPTQHGLQRIEVDTKVRSLALKSLLPAPADPNPYPYPNLWGDRSVQIGPKLVYLTQGQVVIGDW